MEMALETSEASNTARKLQLSANCWTASREGRGGEGGVAASKAGQVYCKEVYNFSGSTDRTFVLWPQLNDFSFFVNIS